MQSRDWSEYNRKSRVCTYMDVWGDLVLGMLKRDVRRSVNVV